MTSVTHCKNIHTETNLCVRSISSPLGDLLIMANSNTILSIHFMNGMEIPNYPSESPILDRIEQELKEYFEGTLKKFDTPVQLSGTLFQNLAWQSLMHIPYGSTISYAEQASRVGNPKATRAVAKANGANPIPIIIPCHRVINNNGQIGGYAGGIDKKEWLLKHEQDNN